MGAVVSSLERAVIDVSWSCHEWFYGKQHVAAVCIKPRITAGGADDADGADAPAVAVTAAATTAPARRRYRHHLSYAARVGISNSGSSSTTSSTTTSSSSTSGSTSSSSSSSGGCERQAERLTPPLPSTGLPPGSLPSLQPMAPAAAPCQQAQREARGLPSWPTFPPTTAVASLSASSDDDEWSPPRPRRAPRVAGAAQPQLQWSSSASAATTSTSMPTCRRRRATVSLLQSGGQRRLNHHHHHHHHHEVDGDVVGKVPRHPKRPSVPYSTLQALLFRCTAARNGCLSTRDSTSKDAYPVSRLGRSWSMHNATSNRAATL